MLRLKIRVHYRLAGASKPVMLFLVLVMVLVTLSQDQARASSLNSPSSVNQILGIRQFYVTRILIDANKARTACAPGYHFASIWEIADTSSLRYNQSLGITSADSGDGPPTRIPFWIGSMQVVGWVRTGYISWLSEPAGKANCLGWLSNYDAHWGTVASLPSTWTSGGQDVGMWEVDVRTCDAQLIRVWCVQDDSVMRVYLPIIIR